VANLSRDIITKTLKYFVLHFHWINKASVSNGTSNLHVFNLLFSCNHFVFNAELKNYKFTLHFNFFSVFLIGRFVFRFPPI